MEPSGPGDSTAPASWGTEPGRTGASRSGSTPRRPGRPLRRGPITRWRSGPTEPSGPGGTIVSDSWAVRMKQGGQIQIGRPRPGFRRGGPGRKRSPDSITRWGSRQIRPSGPGEEIGSANWGRGRKIRGILPFGSRRRSPGLSSRRGPPTPSPSRGMGRCGAGEETGRASWGMGRPRRKMFRSGSASRQPGRPLRRGAITRWRSGPTEPSGPGGRTGRASWGMGRR